MHDTYLRFYSQKIEKTTPRDLVMASVIFTKLIPVVKIFLQRESGSVERKRMRALKIFIIVVITSREWRKKSFNARIFLFDIVFFLRPRYVRNRPRPAINHTFETFCILTNFAPYPTQKR